LGKCNCTVSLQNQQNAMQALRTLTSTADLQGGYLFDYHLSGSPAWQRYVQHLMVASTCAFKHESGIVVCSLRPPPLLCFAPLVQVKTYPPLLLPALLLLLLLLLDSSMLLLLLSLTCASASLPSAAPEAAMEPTLQASKHVHAVVVRRRRNAWP
jgi:hypothetical protein